MQELVTYFVFHSIWSMNIFHENNTFYFVMKARILACIALRLAV
jgi:hypothetical protein